MIYLFVFVLFYKQYHLYTASIEYGYNIIFDQQSIPFEFTPYKVLNDETMTIIEGKTLLSYILCIFTNIYNS